MKNRSTVLSRVRSLVKEVRKELIHFVFPSYCLHCREVEIQTPKLFCSICEEWIHRFPLEECQPFKAVAVEKEGIAFTLLKERNGAFQQEVIATMAAFMALQILELNWSSFDLIIPSPKDPVNVHLAKELSRLFGVPVKNLLKTENSWKSLNVCSDRTLLVAELTLSSSASLEILEEAAPLRVYQISFCK